MQGSLMKRGNYYYAIVGIKDEDGNRKQKTIATKCTKKGDAQKVLTKILYEIEKGDYINPQNIRFADFMTDWLNNIIKCKIEQTTWEGYCTNINVHVAPYFKAKDIKLQDLKTIHIQKYIDLKIASGLSANYIKKHYVNMKKALDYAVRMKIILANPIRDAELPKIQKYEANYYSLDQLHKLFEYAKGTPIESAIYLTSRYGLRRGEALGLRWKDVDLDNRTVTIQNQITRVGSLIEKKPKTKSSIRTYPMGDDVYAYLKQLKREQSENRLLFGNTYIVSDYVCRCVDGNPLSIGNLVYCFNKLFKVSQLPKIRFHDLRHSTASLMLKKGMSLKDIQEWLGHSDIRTTADIYAHIDIEMKRDVAQKMDRVFSGGS